MPASSRLNLFVRSGDLAIGTKLGDIDLPERGLAVRKEGQLMRRARHGSMRRKGAGIVDEALDELAVADDLHV